MTRTFPLRFRSLRLLALVALALALPAHAAVPVAPITALEPLPGSSLAHKLAHQQAEAARLPARLLPKDESVPMAAANFAALPPAPWTIQHQDITLDLDAKAAKLTATIVLTVQAKEATDELLLVAEPLDDVTATTLEGQGIATTVEGGGYADLVHVPMKPVLQPGEVRKVVVVTKATLDCSPEGIGLRPCGLTGSFKYVTFHRYYLTPAVAAHAPFTSDLHVPTLKGEVAAAPGLASGPDPLPDGRIVWHFAQKELADNAGFAIASYEPFTVEPAAGGPTLKVYVAANFADNAQTIANIAKDVLQFYGARYQQYPWEALHLIQLENNFGGGYAPLGAAFMYRDVFGITPEGMFWYGGNELIAHEIGHQWWGDLVSPMSSGDVSLSESLAEFSSCLYTEKQLQTRSQIMTNNLSYVYTVPASQDKPLGSQGVYSSPRYVQIVYHKGAVVMDMLRRELGEEAMLKGLALYAQNHSRDYARVIDLQKAMEKASGRQLTWFFNQWFGKTGAIRADLAVTTAQQADGKWTVRLRVDQPEGAPKRFRLPLWVDLPGAQSETFEVDVIPDGGQTSAIVEVTVPQRPLRVRPDAQRVMLRRWATATPGDSNLSGLVDGADLVDMAFRHGRAVSAKGKNGQTYFIPDLGWNELYDLQPSLRIDDEDVDVLEQWLGTEAETF